MKLSLPQQGPDGTVQPLRIAQRMRLEQAQLDGVAKRMQVGVGFGSVFLSIRDTEFHDDYNCYCSIFTFSNQAFNESLDFCNRS